MLVCHNRRIRQHRGFAGLAARGKTFTGWGFGFKLHLAVNDRGELLACDLTPANVDARQPLPRLTASLTGKLFADRDYLSQALFEQLWQRGLELITRIGKNMKNKLMPMIHKLLLRKRALIETIIDQLKNIFQIAHTRHRSHTGFMLNLLTGLAAYSHQANKPSIYRQDTVALPSLIQN